MTLRNESKILIIDDEQVVLDSCMQILEGENCTIKTATDGSRGLKLLKEFRPSLVFVDLKMPGLSGFEVLEEIRKLDPSIVAIVITGYATVDSAVEAMKRGAYDFLTKPFTPDAFRLITQRGLEKRNLVLETIALRREKELLREHFAAIVSHELKAPLGAIQQNLISMIGNLPEGLAEDLKKRLERMKVRIDDLMKLIHTWLRVISVDIEKIKENFKPLKIDTVLAKAIESVQPHAESKNIEIVTSLEEPLGTVNGDEGTLVEPLVNIIGNAVKYSNMGSQILVTVKERDDSLLISVIDRGVGISEEDLPFILNDFYRGKSSPATEKGSGLGLAISRRIIEAHNGSISVKSELGKGSTFEISLPVLTRGLSPQPKRE